MRSYTYREGGALIEFRFIVNERESVVSESADTPLLYVLTNDLRLQGPRFGCGLGQCGGCSVLVNDVERRSCLLPVSAVQGKRITTLEGIPNWYARKRAHKPDLKLHPVQQAMLLDDVNAAAAMTAAGIPRLYSGDYSGALRDQRAAFKIAISPVSLSRSELNSVT